MKLLIQIFCGNYLLKKYFSYIMSQPNINTLTEEEKKKVLEKTAVIKLDTVFQILKCIDVATSRGAFKGNELSFVGSIHDILNNGLNTAFKEEINNKNEKDIKTKSLEVIPEN